MRTAPPVDYPVARSGIWHHALMALCLLAGGCVGVTWGQWLNQPVWPAVALAVGLAAVAFRHRSVQQAQAPQLSLRWTGQAWELWVDHTPSPVAQMALMHDWGAALLLRGHDGHGRVMGWWPVCRRDAPQDWHRLRLAVHDAQHPPSAAGGLRA